ncbi:MAG: hypothetical protein IJP78_10810 [Clostridia bacterium]|nr:hypothetical protein [Clostridia bacterium]
MSDTTAMSAVQANQYDLLLESINQSLLHGREQIASAVSQTILRTYWEIGRNIVEFEQQGQAKADYGSELLKQLSRDLTARHGTGFSKSNVFSMRRIYLLYPKFQTLSGILTWSHYVELLKLDDPLERSFYEHACVQEHWGVRELRRQMNSMLFQRRKHRDRFCVFSPLHRRRRYHDLFRLRSDDGPRRFRHPGGPPPR